MWNPLGLSLGGLKRNKHNYRNILIHLELSYEGLQKYQYQNFIRDKCLKNSPQNNTISPTETLQTPGYVNFIIFSLLAFYSCFRNEGLLKKTRS